MESAIAKVVSRTSYLFQTKGSPAQEWKSGNVFIANCKFTASDIWELSFEKDDVLYLTYPQPKGTPKGRSMARNREGKRGFIPTSYVKVIISTTNI